MITATLISDAVNRGARGDQRLYKLSEPVPHGWENDRLTEFVVVSAVVPMFGAPETFIFASDAEGNVTDWHEMDGSFVGELNHDAAIAGAGWDLS